MTFIANDFGFIHLPRTGGTFLESFLSNIIPESEYGKHTPAKIVRQTHPNKILFGFVRHPVDWYRSTFMDDITLSDMEHLISLTGMGIMESQFNYYFCDDGKQIVDQIFKFEDGFVNCLSNFITLSKKQINELENGEPLMSRKNKILESKELTDFVTKNEQFIIDKFYS